MTMKPIVSIVTPSYNQASYLERTILSVIEQDYEAIEYIVIDGGSEDGSLEILKKYEHRLAYWESTPDKGQTDAINKGFAHANGQILAWLNSDDTYQPGAIAEVVQFMQAHPQAGLVYGDCNFINARDEVIGRFNARQTEYDRLLSGYVHIPQQAAFWRRHLWQQVAPLDDSIYFAMDYDLWLRLAKISPIVYTPRLWANFRLHGDAKTIAEDDRCWPDMVRIHYRNGGKWWHPLVWKYYLRKLAGPYLRAKRRKMINR